MDARDYARLLLDAGAVKFNVEEPFKYASGILSPVYTDCRLLISDVRGRMAIVEGLLSGVDSKPDAIAATASAGIPWGAWIAEKLGLPLVYVRGKAKEHGRARQIEGRINEGDNAIVIEDLVSTGASSINTVSALRAAKASVDGVISIFSYGMREAKDAFRENSVNLSSLSNFSNALDAALELGYLDREEADIARGWSENPRMWKK
jgi:orotate phosphoribosyltransferase